MILQEVSEGDGLFKRIKMVVFDLCGTTVDEGDLVYKALKNALTMYEIEFEDMEFDKVYYSESTNLKILKYFLNKDGKDVVIEDIINKLHENIKDLYKDIENNVKAMEGAKDLFAKLRGKGIKVCLNSGYSEDIVETIIKKVGFEDIIDGYISGDKVKVGRPFPFMIYRLMEEFNVDSAEYVVKVGDTVGDILEGKNAGVKFNVGVLSGVDGRDRLENVGDCIIIDSVKDLLSNNYF